jgi:HEAT repeat protein
MKGAILAAAALAAAAPPALAHGGSYRPPDAPGGIPPGSKILDPRLPEPTPPSRGDMSPWERWWDTHRVRFLDLRHGSRLKDPREVASGGGSGGKEGDPFYDDEEGKGKKAAGDAPLPARGFLEREVLPVITEALLDGDAEVRSAAALALGKLGFPRSVLDLGKALGDRNRDVRESALLALGMAGDTLAAETLRGVLLDPGTEERSRGFAAAGLGLLGGEEAGDALLAYLDPAGDGARGGSFRRRPETEGCVALALGAMRHLPAIPALRRIGIEGKDPDGSRAEPGVRAMALVGLARMGDPAAIAVETLVPILDGEDREVLRQAAAVALGHLARPADGVATAALAKAALGDRDQVTRRMAWLSLGRIGGDGARKALRATLKKGLRGDLPFAALALAIAGDRESAPELLRLFQSEKDPDARGALAIALGLLDHAPAAPALRAEAFPEGFRMLRGHCMVALGMLRDAASAEPLRKALAAEKDVHVRLQAGLALGLLGDGEAVPRLLEILWKDGNVEARGLACRVLGLVGDREAARAMAAVAANGKQPALFRMFAVAGLGVLGERSGEPLLSLAALDFDPESRPDPVEELSGWM